MTKKERSRFKVLSIVLIFSMFLPQFSMVASAMEKTYITLEEGTIPEDILESDLFYISAVTNELSENDDSVYLLKIGRGGSALQAASVTLKLTDITARLGENYRVRIHNKSLLGNAVNNPQGNQSLVELITESDDIEELPNPLSEDNSETIPEGISETIPEDNSETIPEDDSEAQPPEGVEEQPPADTGSEYGADTADFAIAEPTPAANPTPAADPATLQGAK